MSWDVARLGGIDGVFRRVGHWLARVSTFHRAVRRRRARRLRRNLLRCVIGRRRARVLSSVEPSVMSLDVAGRGVIRGVSCCAVGCRGSTSYAEPFVVSQDVAGRTSLGSTSSAESRRAAGLRRARLPFHRSPGRRRVRRHRWDLIVSQGVAATGSMSFPLVVPWDVAGRTS